MALPVQGKQVNAIEETKNLSKKVCNYSLHISLKWKVTLWLSYFDNTNFDIKSMVKDRTYFYCVIWYIDYVPQENVTLI